MRRLVVGLCVACLVLVAWMLAEPTTAAVNGLRVGEPWQHGNLAIFPVFSEVPRQQDRFITLDEGLEAGTVAIYEVGADGSRVVSTPLSNAQAQSTQASDLPSGSVALDASPTGDTDIVQQINAPAQEPGQFGISTGPEVNRLMVVNRSGKPLYLMPGEVIVGGQQDRTIAEETILAATGEPTPIDVFCVEHGRWSGRDEQEAAAILSAVANPSEGTAAADADTALSLVVREANRGKFVASAGVLNKASRLATQATRDQIQVWDAVGKANAASGVAPASGAFTANYVDAGSRQRLEAYIERLQRRLADEPNVVGVVVAINGKVESVDVFESTPLFQKLWPKLLKSYALDAAIAADVKSPSRRATVPAAQDFLAQALTADVQDESRGEGGLVVQQRAADGVISFTAGVPAIAAPDASAPAGGFGDYGGGVHTSALAR